MGVKHPLSPSPAPCSRAALLEGPESLTHLPCELLFIFHGKIMVGGGELTGRGKKLPGCAWGMARVRYQTARPYGRGPLCIPPAFLNG